MKKLLLCMTIVSCFANDIQEDDFNNLMVRSEERSERSILPGGCVLNRPKQLIIEIENGNIQEVLRLISTMTQEELNAQDYEGKTALMIAIEKGQENVAYLLARVMNKEGLELRDMEGVTANDYIWNYTLPNGMPKVSDTIQKGTYTLYKANGEGKQGDVKIMGVWTLDNVVSYSQIALWKLCKQAIKYNQVSVFKMLFKRMWVPILIHCEDAQNGYTLLEYALRLNRMEIVEILNDRYSQIKW